MKPKTVLIPLIALLLAAGTAFLWLHGWKKAGLEATLLLPTDTLLLVEVRHLAAFESKLRLTALADLWREPELKALLRPTLKSLKIPEKQPRSGDNRQPGRARRAFLAALPRTGSFPAVIAGFETGGDRDLLRKGPVFLARELGFQLESSPATPRRQGKHAISPARWHDHQVETVVVGNHFFISSEPAALDQLLVRLDQPGQMPSLAQSPILVAAGKALPEEWDSRLILQPDRLVANLPWPALVPASVRTTIASWPPSLVAQTRVEGKNFRDSIYFGQNHFEKWPVLPPGNDFSAEAFLDVRLPMQAILGTEGVAPLKRIPLGVLNEIRQWFAQTAITSEEWREAFDPNVRLTGVWPPGSGRPAFQILGQVRNQPAAQKLFARIGRQLRSKPSISQKSQDGSEFILIPTGESQLYTPAATLNRDHLRVISNLEDLPWFNFKKKTVPKPDSATRSLTGSPGNRVFRLNLDTSLLVDRTYRTMRPILMMSAQFSPRPKKGLDLSHLPKVETLTRHLGRVDLEIRRVEKGFVVESSGAITLPQWFCLGLLAAGQWPG